MPITSKGDVHCINGCQKLEEQDGFNFISRVANESPLQVEPAAGFPVKTYLCRKCGYIEFYVGQSRGFRS